jgi:hypothetical protein
MKRTTESSERRRDDRRPTRGAVRVSIETRELAGESENVSTSGVLFLSGDALRVVIEFADRGRTERRTGRLVRAQRMTDQTIGWAVEFDRDPGS